MTTIASIAPRRRRTDLVAKCLLAGGTLIALVPLVG